MLHVEEAGNPDGEPMLLIHGFLSCNHQWMANRDRLGTTLRLIMMELPGHGQSPTPPDAASCAPDRVVEAIDQIRIERGIDQWWVLGQSLGAAVAINYVLHHPDNVTGLIFTNSRAAFGIARRGTESDPNAPIDRATPRDLPFHPVNARRFPDEVKDALVTAADAIDPATVGRVVSHRSAWGATERFGELTMPVLLVNGRWEKAFQPKVPEAQRLIPHLQVVELEGGHSINIEQADAFNEAVLEFIAS